MTYFKNNNVIAMLVGLLLGVGFVIPQLWILALLGIGWLTYLFLHESLSYKKIYVIWFIKSALVTCWVWAVYPIDWIGFDLGWVELPVIAFYWLTVTASLAVGGIAFLFLIRLLYRITSNYNVVLICVPILWLLADMIGSLAFSVFLYGPGGSVGTTFSMGYIGYLLAEHSVFIQLAHFGGVYALSLFFVFLAMFLLFLFEKGKKFALVTSVLLLVGTSVWQPATDSIEGQTHQVVVVDTELPVEFSFDLQKKIHREVFAAAKDISPDYMIFPEDSRVFDQSLDQDALRAYLGFLYSGLSAIVVDSGRVESEVGPVLQAVAYDGINKEIYQSQKSYLVPQGEFLPYSYSLFFRMIGQAESSQTLQDRLAYRVGPDTSQSHFATKIPGILFCFEVVDARGVRKIISERESGIEFVAHIVSHGWIHHSNSFLHQLQSMLRVQAIWNDVYIVKSGNDVKGYTVTSSGLVQKHTSVASGDHWAVSLTEIPRKE